jgi:hypothetical protein
LLEKKGSRRTVTCRRARKHTGFGIASFAVGIVAGLAEFAVIVVAGSIGASNPDGIDKNSPLATRLSPRFSPAPASTRPLPILEDWTAAVQ